MIGVFVHWTYAPHTVDGVVGKDNPLLLASNFSGTWPGLVALLNTGRLPRERRPAVLARSGPTRPTGPPTPRSWSGSTSGARPARIALPGGRDRAITRRSRRGARRARATRGAEHPAPPRPAPDARRHLDGHDQRLLRPAPALPPSASPSTRSTRPGSSTAAGASTPERVDDAFRFVQDRGVTFHWSEAGRRGLHRATPPASSSAATWPCSTCSSEFKADCLGWQYQLGLLPLLPPSDFAEGLLQLARAARRATATPITSAPRPTRATSCRWS